MKARNPKSISCALAAAALLAAQVPAALAASQVNIKVENGRPAMSRQDSLAMVEKARRDSLAMAQKANRDSMEMAGKVRQDSLAMEDMTRQLENEKAKRSGMEDQLLTTGLLVLDAVYFETGKTEISINSKPYLDMLAGMLLKYPKLQIEVDGHTDNVGSDEYNRNLSQGRAKAVMDYLVSKQPELGQRLKAWGFGESVAKADDRTAEGRKLNRRTELRVLNKDALKEYNQPREAMAPAE